jgi:hypothetical protein
VFRLGELKATKDNLTTLSRRPCIASACNNPVLAHRPAFGNAAPLLGSAAETPHPPGSSSQGQGSGPFLRWDCFEESEESKLSAKWTAFILAPGCLRRANGSWGGTYSIDSKRSHLYFHALLVKSDGPVTNPGLLYPDEYNQTGP